MEVAEKNINTNIGKQSPSSKFTVLAIIGATASGKTDVATELASMIPSEIISADSRQVYRKLTIGTAKPPKEVLDAFPHHFIDTKNPDELYSSGLYGDEATNVALSIHAQKKIPILVGGSGLYIKAFTQGLFEAEETPKLLAIREDLERQKEIDGVAVLYRKLQEVDPISAERYNDLNPRRLIRALEYFYATGTPLSTAHRQTKAQRPFSLMYISLEHPRTELYRRINERTRWMYENGIVEETEAVLQEGYSPKENSLNTVGYKECIQFLDGEISRERAVELTAQKTRNYAKRQITWFKQLPALRLQPDNFSSVQAMASFVAERFYQKTS